MRRETRVKAVRQTQEANLSTPTPTPQHSSYAHAPLTPRQLRASAPDGRLASRPHALPQLNLGGKREGVSAL